MKNTTTFLFTFILTFTGQQLYAQTQFTKSTKTEINTTGSEKTGGVPPCYNLTVSDAVCNGSVYTFPDGSFQTITAQVVHTSTLQTVGAPCDSIIETTVDALPTYHQTQSLFDICTGIDYTFPDGTTQTIFAHTEHTSNLQTVVGGCDSIILTVLNTTDIDISVSVSGNTITSHQTNCGYQWVDCDNAYAQIDAATNQSYTAASGNFAVIIQKGGCVDTSVCTVVGTVGINDIKDAGVSVYPNPTNGTFKVNLGSTYNTVNVTIRNVMGQQVQTRTLRNTGMFDASIETAAGMYFIELKGSEGLNVTYKVVKE